MVVPLGLLNIAVYNLNDHNTTSYAADSTGLKNVNVVVRIPVIDVPRLPLAAKLILSYVWAATAAGRFELIDADTGTVLAQSSDKAGGESATDEEISVDPSKISGKRIQLRVNITTAGAAGETVKIRSAQLEILRVI